MRKLIWFLGSVAVVALLAVSCESSAATPAQTFEDVCSECHEKSDFTGEPVKDLETLLTAISAGTLKHKKKFTLTAAENAAMAAYLSK